MGPGRHSVRNGDLPSSKIPYHIFAELFCLQKFDERAGKQIDQFPPSIAYLRVSSSRTFLVYGLQRNRKNIGFTTEKGFCLALVSDFTSSYGFPSWVFSSMELLKHQRHISLPRSPTRHQSLRRARASQQANKSGETSTSFSVCRCSILTLTVLQMLPKSHRLLARREHQQEYQTNRHHHTPN
jgi:hypothetical protein